MEMMEYETPQAWDDKSMDWDDPDPTNCDYAIAIRNALLERCALVERPQIDHRVFQISPYKTVTRDCLVGVVLTIRRICSNFVDIEWDEFARDYSDYPKMWTYPELISGRNCRLYEYPKPGLLTRGGGIWLKQMKTVLDKLTVVKANRIYGTSIYRNGDIHDPPFDESVSTAMQYAFEYPDIEPYSGRFPTSIYAWSGNTHWCWPTESADGTMEGEDGYCGYAVSESYRINALESRLAKAEFDLIAGVYVSRPEGPASFSQELTESVFDSGETGYKEGMNQVVHVHVKDPMDVDLTLGDPDHIPRNTIVPQSKVTEESVIRTSTKRGWIGRIYGLLDYGVEGGFKFRSKEEK